MLCAYEDNTNAKRRGAATATEPPLSTFEE
jgi:hypothetical protein